MTGNELDGGTAKFYRLFGEQEARGKSPLYETISQGVSEDPEILSLLDELPPPKRQPNLFFGAVRFNYGLVDDYNALHELVIEHWPTIKATMMQKRTQTNEVGRCAALLPIFATLTEPLVLIELGTSAGLCLLLDRYGYDFDGTMLNGSSSVVLPCQLSGFDPPSQIPVISWRLGTDIAPIDVWDDEECRWLEALIWPGMEMRAERLHEALQIARTSPPPIERADLRDGISTVLAQAPQDGTTVVFHSAVMPYLTKDERIRLQDELRDAPVRSVSYEGVGEQGSAREFTIRLDGEPVARADGHGAWLTSL